MNQVGRGCFEFMPYPNSKPRLLTDLARTMEVKVRFVLPYKASANPREAANYRGYYKGDL